MTTAHVTDEVRLAHAWLSRNTPPRQRLHHEIALHGAGPTVARLITGQAGPRLQALLQPGQHNGAAALDVALRDLDTVAQLGGRFVIPGDAEWPDAWLGALDRTSVTGDNATPYGLWVRGDLRLDTLGHGAVAIVGSRASTAYGDHVAGDIAQGLAARQITVVSGGALGIDAAAHRGTLAADGHTVAVMATGIDRAYPATNTRLLEEIAARGGALVSAYPPGAAPHRERFLERNQLITALTAGTVVVESAARSGSLQAASSARSQFRKVMAVPGPVTSAMSVGTHKLIRGGAQLVTSAADVVDVLAGR